MGDITILRPFFFSGFWLNQNNIKVPFVADKRYKYKRYEEKVEFYIHL